MRRARGAMLWLVATGLAVALLSGCASHRSGPAVDGTLPGSDGGIGVRVTTGTGAAGTGASDVPAPGGAPGAMLFPGLPAPKDFAAVAELRDIHFDFDRATVRPEDARILDGNARWLAAHPGARVLIEGHADERGTNEYNLALGETRAKATRDQLVARGVAPARITLVSYGEERPLCRTATETCWAQNRRAHFLVSATVAATPSSTITAHAPRP